MLMATHMMENRRTRPGHPGGTPSAAPARHWLLAAGCMLVLALALTIVPPGAAAAPAPAKVAAEASGVPPTPELKALVHTLQDKDQREQLIKQLNALIASQQALHKQGQAGKSAGGGLQQQVTDWLNELHARSGKWVTQFEGFSRARALYERLATQLHNPATRRLWLRELGEMLAALIAAMLAGWLCRRVAGLCNCVARRS